MSDFLRAAAGAVGRRLQAWSVRPSIVDAVGASEAEDTDAFVAILAMRDARELERTLGIDVVASLHRALGLAVSRHLPHAGLGRVGRGIVELTFSAPGELAAEAVLARLRRLLAERLEVDGRVYKLALAIGYAQGGIRNEAAVKGAELAVELAQHTAGKIARHMPEGASDPADRLALLADLRTAIAEDQLFLCYQPKLRAREMTVCAAEALLRWRHPHRGLVPPDQFIPLAEQTGLISDITRWVITRAVEDQRQLADQGHAIEIHVNISGRELPSSAFGAWAVEAVRSAVGVIGFEITETAVIAEPELALNNLRAFAAAGIRVAIDDYGSGLSSLAYLKQLPASELKIDKMFIGGLTTSHRDPLLVRSTIDLAHALEMEVTAEGVEDSATLALLRIMGCDLIQGYAISPALSLDDLSAFLRDKPVHQLAPRTLGMAARQV